MSLNGLEATEVNEAYQSALEEGGGWFLLKYTSRDEVGLLERGGGGLAEVKEAVDRFEEQSPLFGFIQYHRRNFVLKYMPEGTSRLLQARVTVQFQSVAEKLTPHDTVFTFTTSSELRDSKLSAACSLHTTSGSIKSSNESLPPRGLAGITEDAVESPIEKAHNEQVLRGGDGGDADRPTSGDSQSEKTNRANSANRHYSQLPSITTRSPPRPRTSRSNTDKALPPRPASRDKTTPYTIFDYGDPKTRLSIDGRLSSQSARPATRDLHNAYEYKPKVKLGPRPSMDSSAGRLGKPDGAGNFRPVSTLPAGLRLPPRKVVSGRPKSSQAQSSFSDRMSSRRQPLPPAPITPIRILDKKVPIPNNGLLTPAKTPEAMSPKMTPEKRRLMKALQIRQKQLAAPKQVTDLGIETLPNEQEISNPELEAANEATPPAESDLEIRDLSKEEQGDVEASPISILETGEEPSTQASSITDDEEVLGEKKQDSNTEPGFTRSEPTSSEPSNPQPEISQPTNPPEIELPPDDKTEDIPVESANGENVSYEARGYEADLANKALPVEEKQITQEPSLPSKEPLIGEGKQLPRENSTGDLPSATQVPQSMVEEAAANANDTEEAFSQAAASEDADKLLEQRIPTQQTTASQDATEIQMLGAPESSSSLTTNEALEDDKPSEMALPPVDEDEEISLSPPQVPVHVPSPILVSSPKPEIESSAAKSTENGKSRNSDVTATQPSSNNINEQYTDCRVRRQGVVNSMHRVSSPDHLEEHFLSDESFMEELKSATLQEAKPISVSKSPIKPVFPRSESERSLAETRASRSVSSPLTPRSPDEGFAPRLQTPLSARSFSVSQPHRPEAQQTIPPLPKKIGVSTGISQRIKALEQLSARPSSPSSQTPTPNPPAFTSLRKTSQRTPPAPSNVSHVINNISRPSTAYPSPTSSPETAVTSSPFKQFSKFRHTGPESVTVTATIVRDAKNKTPETPLNPSEPRTMDLHQSPLLVEHQPMGPPPHSPLKPPRPRYARHSSARSGSSSSTDRKRDVSPTTSPLGRRGSFASVLSKSSRATSEAEVPRTTGDSAPSGATTPDGPKDEKKDSKRSRLMKRMSSISLSRRSIAQTLSPSPKESPIMEHHEPILETPPSSSIEIGDVNVQFPDTLLWKRRHMVIDNQGIIVLSASKSDSNSKVITKRYALSQFRTPYIPDQDRQELPHSVVLDFIDGSTLQCACEHPQGQAGVLYALRHAHSEWTQ